MGTLEPFAEPGSWPRGRVALSRGHPGPGLLVGPWPPGVSTLPRKVGGVAASCGPAWGAGQPDIPSRCQSGNRKQLVWGF